MLHSISRLLYSVHMIIGIDEVGRGAWAGPLAVGAVAIAPDAVAGLADSKTLTKKRREILAHQIKLHAAWIGIGWVSARKIDSIGMSAALRLAAARAMRGAPEGSDVIIDGTIKLVEGDNVSTLKKADQLIPAVSAAAIIAKVARDRYMLSLDKAFARYEFSSHVGYGTAKHLEMITTYGVTQLHRLSFKPMAGMVAAPIVPAHRVAAPASSGLSAETAAAEYLMAHGYEIIERNWRTKLCEIDIIAAKAERIYFVEVKYRRTDTSGAGFDYVTEAKLQQMEFAARAWAATKQWRGDIQLAAVQVHGEDFAINGFTSDIFSDRGNRARTRRFG